MVPCNPIIDDLFKMFSGYNFMGIHVLGILDGFLTGFKANVFLRGLLYLLNCLVNIYTILSHYLIFMGHILVKKNIGTM
jgi:hypothetical protein